MAKDKTEIYLEERRSLIEAQQQAFQQLDKAILTIASGGLGLSIIFLKDIFTKTIIVHKWLLVGSWGLFVAAILSTLISFLTSQFAYKRQLALTDEFFEKQEEGMEQAKGRSKSKVITELLNVGSVSLLVLAITALVIFVSINFLNGGSND